MPCGDGGIPYPEDCPTKTQFKAALCAAFTYIEKYSSPKTNILNIKDLDWQEAGVNREDIMKWWEKHKKEDQERRNREKAQKEFNKKKKDFLNSLTPEQRKFLR